MTGTWDDAYALNLDPESELPHPLAGFSSLYLAKEPGDALPASLLDDPMQLTVEALAPPNGLRGEDVLRLASNPNAPSWVLDVCVLSRWRPALVRVAMNPNADPATLVFLSRHVPVAVARNPSIEMSVLSNSMLLDQLAPEVAEVLRSG